MLCDCGLFFYNLYVLTLVYRVLRNSHVCVYETKLTDKIKACITMMRSRSRNVYQTVSRYVHVEHEAQVLSR